MRRSRSHVAGFVLALVTSGCLGATTESPAPIDLLKPGRWTTRAPMPTGRQEVAVAVLDGRIFVVGGFGSAAEPVATVEVYDPAEDRWETRANLPVATHHAAAASVEGRLFVIGGYTGGRVGWTPESAVWEYEPARETWVARSPMPTARGGLAVAVLDGRIHAVGGAADAPTSAHEVYDVATNRWQAAFPMPTARDHLAAVAFQGRLWALGGRRSFFGDQYDSVEIYDPRTQQWTSGPPLPTARGGLAAIALPDRILVFGGEAPFRIFNATEMYEPAGKRWIAKEPMPTARHGIGVAAVSGIVYVPGGGTQPGFARTAVNEAYFP